MKKIVLGVIVFSCFCGMEKTHTLNKLRDWIHRNDTETQTASRNLKSNNSDITKCAKACQSLSTDLDKELQKLIKKNLWSIGDLSPILILRILFKNLSIKFEQLSLYMTEIKKALDEYNKGEKKTNSKSTSKQSKGNIQIESARTNLGVLLGFFSSTQLNLMDAVIRADFSFLAQMMYENVEVTYLQPFNSKIGSIASEIEKVISSLLSSQSDMITARDTSENEDTFSDYDYQRLVENLKLYHTFLIAVSGYINGNKLNKQYLEYLLEELKLSPYSTDYSNDYGWERGRNSNSSYSRQNYKKRKV